MSIMILNSILNVLVHLIFIYYNFYYLERFPKNESAIQTWMDSLNLSASTNFKTSYVCSDHFDEESFSNLCDARKRLRSDAIPKGIPQSTVFAKNESQESNVQINSNFQTNSERDILRAQMVQRSCPNVDKNNLDQNSSAHKELENVSKMHLEPDIDNEVESTKSTVGCSLDNDQPQTKKR